METEEEAYANIRISFLYHFLLAMYSVIISELYENFSSRIFNISFLPLLQNQTLDPTWTQLQIPTSSNTFFFFFY